MSDKPIPNLQSLLRINAPAFQINPQSNKTAETTKTETNH